MINPPLRLLMALHAQYPQRPPDAVVQAPERELWGAALRTSAKTFTLHAIELETRVQFTYQSAKKRQTVAARPLPQWARYAAGVLLVLSHEGMNIPNFDAVIAGDEPAGPRYEHALGGAFAALCCALAECELAPAALIACVERARREYVQGV